MGGGLHHRIVIVGGGAAGITVAARLRRAGEDDIALIEPAAEHYYQPLWTLVGAGQAKADETVRREATVVPGGVRWLQDAAVSVDPAARAVQTASGASLEYDNLVVCPGIQLDWDRVPGLPESLRTGPVSSNYRFDLAPKTWELIRGLRSGTALFTMPSGPVKCGGAAQKIAYLASDHWRRQGVLDSIRVVLVLPTPKMFGVPVFNDVLERVVDRYGIDVRFHSEVTRFDPERRQAVVSDLSGGGEQTVAFDIAHVVPPQSAPDWIKASPLSCGDAGYVEVDQHTLQHLRWPEVFSLGDAAGAPNAKTAAAVRKQAPVVVQNLLAHMAGEPLTASYDGYSSCPITTAHNKLLLAEFDYTLEPHPTIPFLNTAKERRDMWLLKRYGLPFMYWNLMLKGLV